MYMYVCVCVCVYIYIYHAYWQNSKEDIILNKYDQTVHNETTLDSINTDFKKLLPMTVFISNH